MPKDDEDEVETAPIVGMCESSHDLIEHMNFDPTPEERLVEDAAKNANASPVDY